MNITRQFASRFAVSVAVTALAASSAFADSRPRNETHSRGQGHGAIQRTAPQARSEAHRSDVSRNNSGRSHSVDRSSRTEVNRGEARTWDRSGERGRIETRRRDGERTDADRTNVNRNGGSYDRSRVDNRRGDRGNYNNGDRRNDGWRGGSRGSYGGGSYNRGSGNRQHYFTHGRISRINRYGGGFRIWVVGAPYPFFIPEAYYYRNHFRVGVSIGIGGYYNPLGYYDYYDGSGYSSGDIRGVVESVDYRRDTFVVRNEATGSFVSVEMRDRRNDVRPGDYVEVSGDWTRSGVFVAYDVDFVDDGYRR